MSTDLHTLLRGAAAEASPPDPDQIWRAGRRRARRRSVVAATSITAIVVGVVAVGTTLRPQPVTVAPLAPSAAEASAAETASATAAATTTPTTAPSEPAEDSATEEATGARGPDAMAADGTIGLDLAQRAAPAAFHPAMLVGPATYAWYMTEVGWTERIPAGSQRQAAMCGWATELGMGTDGFHEALNDQTYRQYSEVVGADGLPLVVQDVCTSGTSDLWEDGDPEPTGDCANFAEGAFASDRAVEDCRRHYGQGG